MPTTQAATRRSPRKVRTRQASGKADGMEAVRMKLAKTIADMLQDQQLTQTEAAYIMRDAPSQISLVVTGKLRGFSTERLFRMLAALGQDIDIIAKPSRGKHGAIRFIPS